MGGVQRLAVGAVSPTISATFRDGNGMPAVVASATVVVRDWAGTSVVASTAATPGATGVFTVTLPAAATAAVTELTATWTPNVGTPITTTVEVVGSRLLWPDEFATAPGVSFSSSTIEATSRAIAWFEDLAYSYMGWSPIERFRQATVRLSSYDRILLPDPYVTALLGVTWQDVYAADVVATEGELALLEVDASSALIGTYITNRALVAYTHGNPQGGLALHDAAFDAVRLHLQESAAGRPPVSISDGLQLTRFSTAGPGHPTGIPEVDEALNRGRFVSIA